MILICQGKCNPSFAQVNADTQLFRGTAEKRGDIVPSVPPSIGIRLRLLKHTKHVPGTGADNCFCVECGAERRFGDSL